MARSTTPTIARPGWPCWTPAATRPTSGCSPRAGSGNPTHFVDVTATIDAGVASLLQHQAYIDGLGVDFDPDQFLKDMAGFIGLGAGCEYAMAFHRYPMG